LTLGAFSGNMYPVEFFAAIELPQAVRRALRAAV
jgi:hypothetical protein